MTHGTVKWFNALKGFGFIRPDSGGIDVFVHISAVERTGLTQLNEGQKVSFETETDRNGKASAVNLKSSERWTTQALQSLPNPRRAKNPPAQDIAKVTFAKKAPSGRCFEWSSHGSKLAEQNQDQDDDQHKAKSAAAVVAGTVKGPASDSTEAAQQCDHQDNEDYRPN